MLDNLIWVKRKGIKLSSLPGHSVSVWILHLSTFGFIQVQLIFPVMRKGFMISLNTVKYSFHATRKTLYSFSPRGDKNLMPRLCCLMPISQLSHPPMSCCAYFLRNKCESRTQFLHISYWMMNLILMEMRINSPEPADSKPTIMASKRMQTQKRPRAWCMRRSTAGRQEGDHKNITVFFLTEPGVSSFGIHLINFTITHGFQDFVALGESAD